MWILPAFSAFVFCFFFVLLDCTLVNLIAKEKYLASNCRLTSIYQFWFELIFRVKQRNDKNKLLKGGLLSINSMQTSDKKTRFHKHPEHKNFKSKWASSSWTLASDQMNKLNVLSFTMQHMLTPASLPNSLLTNMTNEHNIQVSFAV